MAYAGMDSVGTRRGPGPSAILLLASMLAVSCASSRADHDWILRGGTVYDGEGGAPAVTDVAIDGDRVVAVGDLSGRRGARELDVHGLAVAPGFVNMLSWANVSLLHDGRSLSDIAQGVTLEVMGEGWSMGPLNEEMKQALRERQDSIQYDVSWTTLAEYLQHLEDRGVSCNVASFVGATTVRIHELGYEDRAPTPEELARMQDLVRAEMRAGAMGVASALIYAPAFYAETPELVALAEAAAESDGLYITHMRSEGDRLLEGVDELLHIARASGVRAQIYHLKAAGQANWHKLDEVIAKVEQAQRDGLGVTADMYTYVAGATGLDAAMPPWVQEGGYDAWASRLREPDVRQRVIREMQSPSDEWENLLAAAGTAENVMLVGFRNESLRHYIGKTLAAVAAERGKSPEETALDLVVEDGSRVECVYFLMSEENVEKQLRLPWVSFCSDAASLAPEPPFTEAMVHPRAYGCFARLLGHYVRDRGVISLEEAVQRLSSFPCDTLGVQDRGRLRPGYFADVVVFDPERIADRATFEAPHQLAVGMEHVFVNGELVLRGGEHTGAMPGRFVLGPGATAGLTR